MSNFQAFKIIQIDQIWEPNFYVTFLFEIFFLNTKTISRQLCKKLQWSRKIKNLNQNLIVKK